MKSKENLTAERDELKTQFNNLTREMEALQKQYDSVVSGKDHLQEELDKLDPKSNETGGKCDSIFSAKISKEYQILPVDMKKKSSLSLCDLLK